MITKFIVLPCEPARAFALFTTQISRWWPPERRHTADPQSTLILSEEGRFCERDRDGNEVELGAVLVWEPAKRLVLDWYPGTDREHPTRVEVRFEAEGVSCTRIVVMHSATATSEALFSSRAPRYEASWTLVLDALRRTAALDNE